VRVGSNATFSVTAAGTPALAYQWFFNAARLPSATLTNYTCLNARTNDAGSYWVVITNSAGSITSSVATLTVVPRPAFYPVTQTSETINFVWSAVAGQAYQLQYQTNLTQANWNNVGGPITATNSTLAASDAIGPDPQRFYRVVLWP
jgi:hypothetical protein